MAHRVGSGSLGKFHRVQGLVLVLVLIMGWLLGPDLVGLDPAQAATCQTVQGQEVCIVAIKRSAKRFWEYRATVSVAGQVQPAAVYDCHAGLRMDADGFDADLAKVPEGELVCRIYRRYLARNSPPRANLDQPN